MPLNAKLAIETELREGRTVLKSAFSTQPFKVANITEEKQQKVLRLMLMSSSPGVLDGDQYEMSIIVGEGCQLTLDTQSFQRLFQMRNGASQTITVSMAKGSSFCYLPHPVVPHGGAIFRSGTKVFLEEECTLLWGEVISCGRKLNGEVFRFTSYHGVTEIYQRGKLVVKENLLMKPAENTLAGIGQMEGYTHQATLLYLDESAPVDALTDLLVNRLNEVATISFGVSALPVKGIVVRLLGHKAEELFQLMKWMADLIQKTKENQPEKKKVYVT